MTAPVQTPDRLEVALVMPQPHLPLILCSAGFISTLKAAEEQVTTLAKINDPIGAQSAANLLVRLTKAGTELNKARLELVRPFQDQIDSINAVAKAPAARIEVAKVTLKKAGAAWDQYQEEQAARAEAELQRKLAALETQRLAELKATKDKADAIAKQLADEAAKIAKAREEALKAGLVVPPVPEPEEIWEELSEPVAKTATELEIEKVKFAPAPVVVRAAGVRTVTTLVPFVTDVNKLPDFFVIKSPNMAAIRLTYCAGFKAGDTIPVCEGVRFEVQTSTQSTGKGAF